MTPGDTPQDQIYEADARIDWVLAHPGMSDWLKNSLGQARGRNPVEMLNDLALLDYLIRNRAEAQIRKNVADV